MDAQRHGQTTVDIPGQSASHAAQRGRQLRAPNLLHRAERRKLAELRRAIDCDIAVRDFQQDLGIGDKTLTVSDQFLEQALHIGFVRMRCADQIHRDV